MPDDYLTEEEEEKEEEEKEHTRVFTLVFSHEWKIFTQEVTFRTLQ